MPALAWLKLDCVEGFEAAALSRMSQLTMLRYEGAYQQQMKLQDMLAALPGLQQLRHLVLDFLQEEAATAALAALTASSHLTRLLLTGCNMVATAVQHMFRPGWLLPDLVKISIVNDQFQNSIDNLSEEVGVAGLAEYSLALDRNDAARLVNCCPTLQHVAMLAVEEGVPASDLAPLLQLSALTYLGIGGAGCDDVVAEQLLAKLTGKRCCLLVQPCTSVL
jgi:hypothetical protein